ncbi:MAG: efflux RND transporter periplasmic adaptor subunit [Magnetococcales bacterium]|nr:efflux RND transporter periplasmic adaptor subunit [Magnetococcales bacterium]
MIKWLVVAGFLLAVCADAGEKRVSGREEGGGSVAVGVRPVEALLLPRKLDAPARVVGLKDARLGPEVAGTVSEILVEVGDRVTSGAPLVRLDGWEYRAALAQLDAALAEARIRRDLAGRQLERMRQLRSQGQGTAEQLDSREAESQALGAGVKRLEAEREQTALRLDKCQLKAPFSGVVVEKSGMPGQWAAPGTPLLRLVDDGAVEVSADLDREQAASLSRIRKGTLQVGGQSHPLTLRSLLGLEREGRRTREARFTLDASPKPAPGVTGRLFWESAAATLPSYLLVKRDNRLGLFLLEGDIARFHPIQGAVEGQPVPFDDSLAGRRVITDGREGLSDGQSVSTVP